MNNFATLDDVMRLFRKLTADERDKAEALIPVVSDSIRQEALKVGKNIDNMVEEGKLLKNVLTSVTVDIIARALMTSTNTEPMTQVSQSALGYSMSGTYLVPGGGLFIKKSELARLGLRKQRYGVIDFYDVNKGNANNS